jgi:hypothetical protein
MAEKSEFPVTVDQKLYFLQQTVHNLAQHLANLVNKNSLGGGKKAEDYVDEATKQVLNQEQIR